MSDQTTNPGDGELLPDAEVDDIGALAPDGDGLETEVELDDDGNPIEPPDEDEEVEEVEEGGKKYAVPKALAARLMKAADYTQKTQALAEQRRLHEEEVSTWRKTTAEADQALSEDRAKVVVIDHQLAGLDAQIAESTKALANVDWDALARMVDEEGRPIGQFRYNQAQAELQRLRDAKDQLSGDKTKITGEIETRTKTRALELQQASAKQIEQRDATLSREIPDWTKRKADVEAFAIKRGVPEAALKATTDPMIFVMLDLAMEGAAARDAKKAAAVTTRRVQPTINGAKPIPRIAGASTPRTAEPRDTASWIEKRNADLAKKGRR